MRLIVAVLPVIALLACSSPSNPAKAEPPVNQQIIDRYSHAIWPAIVDYNAVHAQGSPQSKKFWGIVDPHVTDPNAPGTTDDFGTLRDAVWKLGRQGEYDPQTKTSYGNEGLRLSSVDVASSNGVATTLNVCYSYTETSYVALPDVQKKPGASAMTVNLTNVNNTWYLHSITDDHVVPECRQNNA